MCWKSSLKQSINLFKLLERILYFGLWVLSFYCMWDAYLKYQDGKTSFKLYSEPITEYPTLTACFNPVKPFQYGIDFHIEVSEYDTFALEVGANIRNEEIFFLEKINTQFMGTCYQIKCQANDTINHFSEIITFVFNEYLSSEELPSLEMYVTSSENSHGVVYFYWMEGDVLTYKVKRETLTQVLLNVEKKISLKSKTNCKDQSSYQCFASLIKSFEFHGCPKRCLPPPSNVSLSFLENHEMDFCVTEEELVCSRNALWTNVTFSHMIKTAACPKSCTVTQYSGKVTYEGEGYTENHTTVFYYNLNPPAFVDVHEEYLVYDLFGSIGSVGGTLGLFMGFSFVNVINRMLKFMQNVLNNEP